MVIRNEKKFSNRIKSVSSNVGNYPQWLVFSSIISPILVGIASVKLKRSRIEALFATHRVVKVIFPFVVVGQVLFIGQVVNKVKEK